MLGTLPRRMALVIVLSSGAFAAADDMRLIELKTGDTVYVGRSAYHTPEMCWLYLRDGRLQEVELAQVTEFGMLDTRFRSLSTIDMRDAIQKELGRDFEGVTAGRYVVAAARGRARGYAPVFEAVSRSFQSYFSRRGFTVQEPEFPLTAIIFPTRAAFMAYGQKEGVTQITSFLGYYSQHTNRVALFDPGDGPRTTQRTAPRATTVPGSAPVRFELWLTSREHGPLRTVAAPEPHLPASGTIDAGLQATMVHEATHQLAFNTGLEDRLGENPRWLTEGLAMYFEQEANLNDQHASDARLNPARHEQFVQYRAVRRKKGSLATFVAEDQLFATQMGDAYSESWALTHFLAETRRSQFNGYLRLLASRKGETAYAANQRLADFQKSFGKDLSWLEVEYLRYYDALQ